VIAFETQVASAYGVGEGAVAEHQGAQCGDVGVEGGVGLDGGAASDVEAAVMDLGVKAVVTEPQLEAGVQPSGALRVERHLQSQDEGVDAELGGPRGERVAAAPPRQREEDRLQLAAAFGELVRGGAGWRTGLDKLISLAIILLTLVSEMEPRERGAVVETRYLDVAGGRLAYDVEGAGPLVVCAPGMGDLRGEYRFLAPQLVAAGYRVATLDVRGHGESSVGWPDYSVAAIGADMLALVRALGGGPVILVGTSMAAGAAVWAAAEAPGEVAGLVVIGPAVRDGDTPAWQRRLNRVLYEALFVRPWGPALWQWYFASLFPSAKPADFAGYARRLGENLREPGRLEALRRMVLASKAASEARLARVTAPTLVVMGSKDRDFKDPAGEARLIAERLHGTVTVRMFEGAGHYPHAEMPAQAGPEIVGFLGRIPGLREGAAHGA
jgi:pimeloyl-ACP methyl ester carboxylesterase